MSHHNAIDEEGNGKLRALALVSATLEIEYATQFKKRPLEALLYVEDAYVKLASGLWCGLVD